MSRDPVDDFLEALARTEAPTDLVPAVMARLGATERASRARRWWMVAAAAALTMVLGAGAVWIGTRPTEPSPSPSIEPSPGPTLFIRTFGGRACPQAALPPGPITFRIDPAAPEPDQVVAIDAMGQLYPVLWAVGFTGGPLTDPVVRDPAGEVVARDGEQFRLAPDDARLHGYLLCSGSGNLYVMLEGREDPDATPSLPPATDLGLLPGTWVPIADAPIAGRQGHTAVWSGTEMLVWGGEPGPATPDEQILVPGADGAAYDPRTDTWRVLAAAPLEARTLHSAAWTGTEMIVWGGVAVPGGRPIGDGAAYDPATDRWRALPPPPFEPSDTQHALWAFDELVIVDGDLEESDEFVHLNVAAYSPATDDWRTLPALDLPRPLGYSLAFTGSSNDVVLLLTWVDRVAGYALNRGAGEWRLMPDPPMPQLIGGGAMFTGTEILVAATTRAGDVVAAFDVARETWRIAAPPLGLGGGGNTWTGTLAFFGLGTGGMDRRTVYDPTRDVWFGVPDAAGIHREFATQVWADDRLLVWGGFEGESFLRRTDGMAFVPDARYAIATPEFRSAGSDLRVEVVDRSGSVAGVRRATDAEFASIDFNQASEDGTLLVPLGPRSVLIYWLGGPGDDAARIELGADGRTIDFIAVPTYGDSIPFARAIVLEFDHDVAVEDLELVFWNGRS